MVDQPGRVPYTGVPTVAPQMPRAPVARIDLHVPAIQFSDAVGRGLQALGHGQGVLGDATRAVGASMEHAGNMFAQAGNELFSRAVALQEVKNETATNEAQSAYDIQQGMLDANFVTLKGNNASEQLAKHLQDTQDLRKKFRDGLTNDAQRRQFDTRTMAAMGRSMTRASLHAGVETKNAYINSLNSDVLTWNRQVQNSPMDEGVYEDAQNGLHEAIRKKNQAMGNDPKVAEEEFAEAKEKLLAGRLTKMSEEQPNLALEHFERLKGEMKADTRDQVEHTIMNNVRTAGIRGAVNNANKDLLTGKMDDSKNINDRVKEALEALPPAAQKIDGIEKSLRAETENRINNYIQDKRLHDYQTANKVLSILEGKESPNGRPPRTVDDFKAHPQGKAIYDGEDPVGQKKIETAIFAANNRRLIVDPETSARNFQTWKGLASQNPAEFINRMQDPTVLFGQVNKPEITFLRTLYDKMTADPKTNAQVTQAVQWLHDASGNTLVQLGIDRLKKDENEEDYYNFRGGILTAIEEWQAANPGKKLTQREFLDKLAPDILKWKPSSWWNWTYEEPPFWRGAQEVPEAWDKQRRHEIAADTGLMPEDIPKERIQRDYMRFLYRKAIEKKPK
jgi:hypothetical protein